MHMRTVYTEDAINWLKNYQEEVPSSMLASLPDISEFQIPLDEWRKWFQDTAELILSKTSDDGVAIFFQTDIKYQGAWIDKAFIVQKAAEVTGHTLLWHKIFCRGPAGTITMGRPAYSHMLCFSKNLRFMDLAKSTADVIPDLGEKTWERGMGLEASLIAARYILNNTPTKHVIHSFCGEGSFIAAAEFVGLSVTGIEKSPRRSKKAKVLQVAPNGKSFLREE